jgi:serine/threonine-protein kinase
MADPLEALRTSLADRYRVERELGEGGMATVYLADDVRHGRQVAIKVIRAEVAAALGTERFLTAIKLTASLQHPHILALLDSGVVPAGPEPGDRPFYVMPYVAGETLRARIARDGALPCDQAVGILAEIADALASAHQQGIVHRDIKPENILLGQGHAMVTDFGVAKALHRSMDGASVTGVGVSLGTPAYMSPEQAVGDPSVDHRADLYAVGVVGYEVLTGHLPFSGPNVAAIVAAVLTQPAPSVATASAACPPRLAALVDSLLAKDPSARPNSAAAVRDTLRSILVELSAMPTTIQPVARAHRSRFAIGAAMVILATTIIGVWHPWRAAHPARPATTALSRAAPRSIAVLPFDNMNRDSTTDYFSDGMAEELISALGRLRGLRVASRTSTFAMKNQGGVLADVGRRLGVGTVVEGSVRRAGDLVRVTAYDAYLRGRYFLGRRNASSIATAIRSFQTAIERDSSFAPAYAGLADAYSLAAPFGGRRPREVFPLAHAAAERALALDSTLAEAHTSLGIVSMFYDWNWPAAGLHLKRGVDLNPSSAEGRLFYSWFLLLRGRTDDARAEITRAQTLDQLSVIIDTRRGTLLQYERRDREAIPFFRQALDIDSTFFFARAELAVSLLRTGEREASRQMVPRAAVHTGSGEGAYVAWILAQLGDTTGARQSLRAFEAAAQQTYVSADVFAGIYASLGDSTRALDLLDKAAEERAFTLVFPAKYPMFDSLHGSARFRRLVDRVGVVAPSQ